MCGVPMARYHSAVVYIWYNFNWYRKYIISQIRQPRSTSGIKRVDVSNRMVCTQLIFIQFIGNTGIFPNLKLVLTHLYSLAVTCYPSKFNRFIIINLFLLILIGIMKCIIYRFIYCFAPPLKFKSTHPLPQFYCSAYTNTVTDLKFRCSYINNIMSHYHHSRHQHDTQLLRSIEKNTALIKLISSFRFSSLLSSATSALALSHFNPSPIINFCNFEKLTEAFCNLLNMICIYKYVLYIRGLNRYRRFSISFTAPSWASVYPAHKKAIPFPAIFILSLVL